jgi:phosphate-selective porin OprO/OprP
VQDENQAAKGPSPIVGAGADGFYLRSPDKAFELKLRGYTQFDGRYFSEEQGPYVDTWLFRRVRPILEGTLGNVVDFKIMPDFAGSQVVLQDVYANLRYFPMANLQVGKYKAPFGLERLQSATALMFAERALPTNLVPNRDLGLMLHGILGEGLFQYQLAFMNGVVDGGSADVDNGNAKDVVARIFTQPFQSLAEGWLAGLGMGFAFDYGVENTPGSLPTYKTAGQSTFFAYATGTKTAEERVRFSPQLTYYWGPFGLLSEYVNSQTGVGLAGRDKEFDNQAWQIAASYVLTGESASYKGVLPSSSFSVEKGTWGAFEVAARYNELRVDPDVFATGFANPLTQAQRARAWGVGGNWYLNRWVKLMLDYERTYFHGGGGGTLVDVGDRGDESVFFFRTQLAF